MNENLNLVEILKDCPSGVEFYSPMCGKITFNRINEKSTRRPIETDMYIFTTDGKYNLSGECMLFPSKDQRDWSKWHRPFVDGDVVYAKVDGVSYIIIYHKQIDERVYRHVCLCLEADMFCCDKDGIFTDDPIDEWRLATEEEKQKLFDVIKSHGYKWYPETKTLEKLIVPKFKVGDKIRHKDGGVYCTLGEYSEGISAYRTNIGLSLTYKDMEQWELVPNKFDPKTLQPFDKVLTRDLEEQSWDACIYSHMNEYEYYPFTASLIKWRYCIPYNDDTKHLIGKTDEAPEFYRYWEE